MDENFTSQDLLSTVLTIVTLKNAGYALLAYVTFKVAQQIIYYRFIHPLKEFPGPFWASVTRLWVVLKCIQETELSYEWEWIKKNGPVMRITPTMLLVSDHKLLPQIYHRTAEKTRHYSTGGLGATETLVSMRSYAEHAHNRRLVAAPYSFSNVLKTEPLVDEQISVWIDMMDLQFARTAKPLDFAFWGVGLAFDVISTIGFGKPFGFIETGKDVGGLIRSVQASWKPLGILSRMYPFTEWLKTTPLNKYLVASPSMKNGVGVLMRWRDKVINERIRGLEEGKQTERVDVLQALLNVRTPDSEPLSPERIRGETLLIILAGADTSGTALCAILDYVMSSPADYSRMMAEIDAADTAGKLSYPVPKFSEVAHHLPFYMACVKESMRLCPSGSTLFPRYVSGDQPPLVVEGKTIPVGTEVSCNPYMIGRDKTLYGGDAETFRPDRWLEDGEKTKLFEKYSMVFGYGTRVCLGKEIATLELFKAPLTLFRTFKLTPCSPATGDERHGPPKLMIKSGMLVWKDLWIDIEKRK